MASAVTTVRPSTMAEPMAIATAGAPMAIALSTARCALDHGSDRIHGQSGRRDAIVSPTAPM